MTEQEQEGFGVLGTIPSVVNVRLNTEYRRNIIRFAKNMCLDGGGVLEAFKKTPIIKVLPFRGCDSMSAHEEKDGVRILGTSSGNQLMLCKVPYDYFEAVLGIPIQFPLSLGGVWDRTLDGDGVAWDEDSVDSTQSAATTRSDATESDVSS